MPFGGTRAERWTLLHCLRSRSALAVLEMEHRAPPRIPISSLLLTRHHGIAGVSAEGEQGGSGVAHLRRSTSGRGAPASKSACCALARHRGARQRTCPAEARQWRWKTFSRIVTVCAGHLGACVGARVFLTEVLRHLVPRKQLCKPARAARTTPLNRRLWRRRRRLWGEGRKRFRYDMC